MKKSLFLSTPFFPCLLDTLCQLQGRLELKAKETPKKSQALQLRL